MDHRIPLKEHTSLRLQNSKGEAIHCVIEKEIGRGGSCIVYEASRKTNLGNLALYRVKEFYPFGLRIEREGDGRLVPVSGDAEAFRHQQEQFCQDFSRANWLFYSGENYASMANQLDVFSQNGTSYVLISYSSPKTLATYRPESVKECVNLTMQVAYVLGNIHQQGFLYLDTKPDNVLIVDGFQKHVLLFDFHSLLPMGERCNPSAASGSNAGERCNSSAASGSAAMEPRNPSAVSGSTMRISYTKGFAAVELQTARMKRIGPQTDVYGVGALLFYLLFGRAPGAPDCEEDARYDFGQMQYESSQCDDKLFAALAEFFHRALAVYYADRYASMQEVLAQLGVVERYADPTIPRIYSTKMPRQPYFFGREAEFAQLDALLERVQGNAQGNAQGNRLGDGQGNAQGNVYGNCNCIFLTGMGGIGKSTFIREYLARRHFDTALYMYYTDSMDATISDDRNIEINTLKQAEHYAIEERYFDRKVQRMRELVRGTNSILVIDNFTGKIDADVRDVLSTDFKVVLITRQKLAYQASVEIHLQAISDPAALQKLFEANLGRPIREGEAASFAEIRKRAQGHTLVLELIAKQIAASHMTLDNAVSLATQYGFSSIAAEKVDYEKDQKPGRDTIGAIIDALFEAGSLSDAQKMLMKVASLLGDRGIGIRQFCQILSLDSMDDVYDLARDGWLAFSGDIVTMHRVIQEAIRRWPWREADVVAAEQFLEYFYLQLRNESTKNNLPKSHCAKDSHVGKHSHKRKQGASWRRSQSDRKQEPFAAENPLAAEKGLAVGKVSATGELPYAGKSLAADELPSAGKSLAAGELPSPGKSLASGKFPAANEAPADMEKIAMLLAQSEDILRECKREPMVTASYAYVNLRYEAILNTPTYRESYILAETADIFQTIQTEFLCLANTKVSPKKAGSFHSKGTYSPAKAKGFHGKATYSHAKDNGIHGKAIFPHAKVWSGDAHDHPNPIAIMRLYAMVTLIHADNHRFGEAEWLLGQAKSFLSQVRGNLVSALYYDLFSDYYDTLLDGHYDTENERQEELLQAMLEAEDRAIHYAKRCLPEDENHLYAKNILGKATVLMRSGRGSDAEIRKLLGAVQEALEKYAPRYANVRLQYYLVCAWYFALVRDDVLHAERCIGLARKLSDAILPTDMQKIEWVIMPCANIYFELRCHAKALQLLARGIELCENHANTESYDRIKQELFEHLCQVWLEAPLPT